MLNRKSTNPASLAAILLFLFTSAATCRAQDRWVGSWTSSQQLPEPQNSLPAADLRDATLRQVVHLSIGGTQLRLRLSNRFGSAPFYFASVHVARPASSASDAINPATDKALTFSGRSDVTVPAGADYISDPISFPLPALSDLTVTIHFDVPPAGQTGHPGSRATSYLVHGDFVSAATLPQPRKVEHWYFISGVEVMASRQTAAIAVLGDSITDGHGATTDANNRWPDLLAKRLQADPSTQSLAVLNQGIGGNRLLLDGLGPNALARFDDDVLAPSGVRFLIVLEGINDLGMLMREGEVSKPDQDAFVHRMLAAYVQMIERAHAHGIKVIGATLLPFVGTAFYHPGPASEADRQTINEWIRTPGHFDAFIDFDQVTRDPEHPDRLLPAYDSGDHLHPSPAGYAAMAEAIPLSLFTSTPSSAAPPSATIFDPPMQNTSTSQPALPELNQWF
ncbi:MAG: SGNH/GDSL hydrolase family protein [Candidatus Acidiferrum sp.]